MAVKQITSEQLLGRSVKYPVINLRVHSAYSLLEGALQLKQIIAKTVADEAPAVAITDTNNLFGALQFSVDASSAGLQPIIGCAVEIDFDDGITAQNQKYKSAGDRAIALYATNETGYHNLVELVSALYLSEDDTGLVITIAQLKARAEGLICLTGGEAGPIQSMLKDHGVEAAKKRIETLKTIFGDKLYVEIQRPQNYDQALENKVLTLAYEVELPIVAVNDSYFASADDYEAHDALLAIADGAVVNMDERRRLTPDHHLMTQSAMRARFADLPEALENTCEIAQRCAMLLKTQDPMLPSFVASDTKDPEAALAAEADELARQARLGLIDRLQSHECADGYTRNDYDARLEVELDIIRTMGFPGYFLIVADFIKWAKDHDIPVGPGRGSGAGSLVAYALTITDIDPLRYSLLFERFLNPARVSMPDFDIDFCQDRRDEVITYVQQKYGREQVAQIITFGTLQARAVLRDTGRVLQMPYSQVDRLCKLIPNNPANPTPLSKAVEEEPRFAEEMAREPIVGQLINIAKRLEGLYRHASTHAAGIVIGDRPLSQIVPMYRDPRSDMPVTQFNMKWVEKAGLVKFDFLGLKTLTVLEHAAQLVRKKGGTIDLAKIPIDDAATYKMLSDGATVGIFQVESAGMRKALLGMKPDRIEDIIALVALYRPGPMENIPDYNARKNGEQEVPSIHPLIDHLVEETYGVIVYQEQVMQIAQELSGYSLGEADLLRRAMGKKIRSEMDAQRERFVEGAKARDIAKPQANQIFDLLAKFADYGFNKSHAAAYGVVSYQTAYMKTHYPVEFLAASMTYDMINTDKLSDFRREAERMGITVLSPSVQTSFRRFGVGENQIFYALAAIKGVGEGAADHIAEARGEEPFASIEDFCSRIDPRIINKRAMENLIAAGALDCFHPNRAALFAGAERLAGFAARIQSDAQSGQGDIFASSGAVAQEKIILPDVAPWSAADKLKREFDAVGFYLSAHPLDEYRNVLERMRIPSFMDFTGSVKKGATAGKLAGTIASKQERNTRTGNRMGIVVLSDASGQYEAVMFSETLSQYRDMLEVGQSVIVTVAAENRPEGVSLRIQRIETLDQVASKSQSALRIYVRDAKPLEKIAKRLSTPGNGDVTMIMVRNKGAQEVEFTLPDKVAISQKSAAEMRLIEGVIDVEIA